MKGIPRLPWGRMSPRGKQAAPLGVPGLRGQAEPASVHSLRQKCWPGSPKAQAFGTAAWGVLSPAGPPQSPILRASAPWELARAAAALSGRNAEVNGGSGVGRPDVEGAGLGGPLSFPVGRQ